ncbi:X8 domain [Musa troglodytarum]|uniref:X8 domain n=1 Tax=Musa troglodytarum TaxID=320322 RepID=A0A9E7GGC5_9LILI|nr:X8 domain [Musa troglodytarum]
MARGAETFLSLTLLLIYFTSGERVQLVPGQKTWCVAKPSSDDATLLENIDYVCSQVDCSVLQRGFPCFYPDNLMSHASIAMNLYYQSRGRNPWNCFFNNSALVATTDPSYGSCAYA